MCTQVSTLQCDSNNKKIIASFKRYEAMNLIGSDHKGKPLQLAVKEPSSMNYWFMIIFAYTWVLQHSMGCH